MPNKCHSPIQCHEHTVTISIKLPSITPLNATCRTEYTRIYTEAIITHGLSFHLTWGTLRKLPCISRYMYIHALETIFIQILREFLYVSHVLSFAKSTETNSVAYGRYAHCSTMRHHTLCDKAAYVVRFRVIIAWFCTLSRQCYRVAMTLLSCILHMSTV